MFEGLFAGTIPVYRGSKTIARFMPASDSFIDANDLTPLELAEKLKAIDSDRKLYDSYFAFKKRSLSPEFQSIGEMSYVHPNLMARLCNFAQTNSTSS